MFPPKTGYGRFEERAVRKYPQRGDISARSALTIHRGTRNESQKSRPVLVLGVDAPGAGNAEHHDMAVTKAYWEQLPERVQGAPDVPGRRRADADHAEAHHRGPRHGRGVSAPASVDARGLR